jgi:hypothetical protein
MLILISFYSLSKLFFSENVSYVFKMSKLKKVVSKISNKNVSVLNVLKDFFDVSIKHYLRYFISFIL